MARQHGNSGRGPDDLDRAQGKQGRSVSSPGAGQGVEGVESLEGVESDDETLDVRSRDDEGSEESVADELDDRSMRAHGSDRAADGQHGLSGGTREPGSGPRHK